jgi:threonylcarbamoyladenosine tRNA methylthiotransferase MtaB
LVKKALSVNPNAFVAIIGCYAQLKPKEIAKIYGVNMVLGANEKFNLVEHIENTEKTDNAVIKDGKIKEVQTFIPSYSQGDRTRTFFKIQDGCDYFCSFCTIPLARGKSRSNTIAQTIETASEIAQTGVKEVVLTGVNIGDFGIENNETFFELIQQLDTQIEIPRFRISSIEPNLLTDKIIEFVADSKRFVPHFHIPLQSGSDTILKLMRRKYDTNLYRSRIEKIKKVMPDCCIGVDVIVGFPGETEEEFMKTYHFIQDLPVSYLHVFTYSERNQTTAIKMEGVVPLEERSKRSKMLHILSEKKKRAFYQTQLHQTKSLLVEAEQTNESLFGFTENYLKVKIPYDSNLINQIISVEINGIDADGHALANIHEPIQILN